MQTSLIKTISRRAALKTLPVGVTLAFCLGLFMTDLDAALQLLLMALPGLAFLIFFTYIFAPTFGLMIYEKDHNVLLAGFLLCLSVLFSSILCSAIIYGLANFDFDDFVISFLGPLYWIFTVGTIPCIALAYIFGHFFSKEVPNKDLKVKPVTALILLFIVLAIYSGISFTFYFFNKAIPEEVVLPKGYEGPAIIIFGQKTHGKKAFNGQIKSYRISHSGILYSQFEPSEGLDPEKRFYYQSGKIRIQLTQKFLQEQEIDLRFLPGNRFDQDKCQFRYKAFYIGKNAKEKQEKFRTDEYIRLLIQKKKIDCSLLDKINQ